MGESLVYSLEEKLRFIEESNSMEELPPSVLPPSHKESYYFVSYSHKDYKQVLKDILLLEAMGINIWYDSEMHIGENWREIAQLYISKFQCAGVIFYLTENSISSPACNQEVEYVLTHDKSFLSINATLEGCGPMSGYAMLRELMSRGLTGKDDMVKTFQRAFSDDVLFLSADASPEKKAHHLKSLKREELYKLEPALHPWRSSGLGDSFTVTSCRDNTILAADLSRIHEIDGKSGPISEIDDCVFTNSIKLQSVRVSNSLCYIGESAFRNCSSLRSMDISGVSTLSIGNHAFRGCTALSSLDLSRVDQIGERAFEGCALFSVDRISASVGGYAFKDTALTDVVYDAERPRLGDHAFDDCSSLVRLKITHPFCTDLGDDVFSDCKSLESVGPFLAPWSFPGRDSDTLSVGAYCFHNCEKLTEVRFSGGWDMSQANCMFWNCRSLRRLDLDIAGTVLPDSFARRCQNLCEVTHSQRFTAVGEEAFEDCSALKAFDLDNTVTVGTKAFVGSGLERAFLKNAETVGDWAFASCKELRSVYIGESCRHLGRGAFSGCNRLKTVKILSKEISTDSQCDLLARSPVEILYLCSEKLYYTLVSEGVMDGLRVLYMHKSCADRDFLPIGFTEAPCDDADFRCFIRTGECVIEEEDVDLTSAELGLPDPNRPKFRYRDQAVLPGYDVRIQHARLKQPHVYFVESVRFSPEDSALIDQMTVSVHNGVSFVLDGTLIKSLEACDAAKGLYFDIEAASDLEGKTCCIRANGDLHYGEVIRADIGGFTAAEHMRVQRSHALKRVFLNQDGETRAISGLDITAIIVFDEIFNAVMTLSRL